MTESTNLQGAPRSLLAFLRDDRADATRPSEAKAPRAPRKRMTRSRRLIALGMLVMLPLISIFGATAAFATDPSGSGSSDSMQYSFYKVASSAYSFWGTMQQPDKQQSDGTSPLSDNWKTFINDPGSAGSLLGYADPDLSNVGDWLDSKLSGSSQAIGYNTMTPVNSSDSSNTTPKFPGMTGYAYFGAALNGMGLDGTSTGLSLGFMNWISGGIILLLFLMSGAVDFVFNSTIGVLSMLNPFKLFYAGISAIDPALANGMVGDGSPDVGPLSGLVSWIGGWYQLLNSLSWTVMVPLFVAILIVSLILFKKLDRGSALKKIVIRVVFIGIGLPLLGSMYTGVLTSMSTASSDGNAASTKVVMSTYVDFENWALNSRLMIPSDAVIEWDASSAQPSDKAQQDVRNTALAINNQTMALGLNSIVSAGSYDASYAKQIMDSRTTDQSSNSFSDTVDMLVRYMDSAQFSSAAFETTAKGDLTQSDYYASNGKDVQNWFDNMNQSADQLNQYDPRSNPLVAVTPGLGLRATEVNGVTQLTTNGSNCIIGGTSIVAFSSGAPRACNLSPLAMYNYLNTDFGSTSMKMYSSSNVASEATRQIHNSVDQVGSGTMSFLYWFDAAVLLASFVVIGLGYAFTLLFASIRRSFQIVTAVPFATLGAIAAIAKVVVYSIALILEVVVTIFVYKLVTEFLTSLPQIIEMPFATVLNNGANGALAGFVTFLVTGWGFGLVVTLLSIIGVVAFTVLAMRIRKILVKAIEEAVTKLVEKFMDTSVGMPGGGKLAPALAGGLAAGAGSAAANRMMTGGKSVTGNQLTPGNSNAGPDGVSTDGGEPTGPEGGDGQGELTEGGASGNGDPGSGMLALPAGDGAGKSAAEEVELGRDVQANGLSKDGDMRAPQVGDDAMSAASDSIDKSAAGFKDADKKRLEAGTAGVKAAGNAAVATGRGVAGDYAGAAKSGGKALEHGGTAVAAGQRAKQAEADAGRSSLDKPNQKAAQRAVKAESVAKVGRSVSNLAGKAGGGTGASPKAPKAPKAPQMPKAAKAPQAAPPAPKPAPRPAPAPKAPKPAPKPAPQRETQEPDVSS